MLGPPLIIKFITLSPIKKKTFCTLINRNLFKKINHGFECFFYHLIERNLLKWLCLSTSVSQQCWCKSAFEYYSTQVAADFPRTDSRFLKCVCRFAALSLRDSMQNLIMNQQLSSKEHHENIPVILILASAPPGFSLKRFVCIWQKLIQLASCQDVCLLVLFTKRSITGTVAYAQELIIGTNS